MMRPLCCVLSLLCAVAVYSAHAAVAFDWDWTVWVDDQNPMAFAAIHAHVPAASAGANLRFTALLSPPDPEFHGGSSDAPFLGDGSAAIYLAVPKAWLWSAESPVRCALKLSLLESGRAVEECSAEIGLRQVEVQDDALLINHRPVHFRGLVHASTATLRMDEARRLKELGVNALYWCGGPPDEVALAVADHVGLYVMLDRPLPTRHASVVAWCNDALPANASSPSLPRLRQGREHKSDAPAIAVDWIDLSSGAAGGLVESYRELEKTPGVVGAFAIPPDASACAPVSTHRIDKKEAACLPRLGGDGPRQLCITWDGPPGGGSLGIECTPGAGRGRLEIACNGRLVAAPAVSAATQLSVPLAFTRKGAQQLDVFWCGTGNCGLDALELRDEKDRRVWRLTPGREALGGQSFPIAWRELAAAYAPLAIREVAPLNPKSPRWELSIDNRMDTTNLVGAESEIRVQFWSQGRTWFQSWQGPPVDVPARSQREVALPLGFLLGFSLQPSAVEWSVRDASSGAALGRISANLLPRAPVRPFAVEKMQLEEKNRRATIKLGDARLVFDARVGALVEYRRGRTALIDGAVGVSVWRPPLPHEVATQNESPCELSHEPVVMEVKREKEGTAVHFQSRYHHALDPAQLVMEGEEVYTIFPNGSVELRGTWTWRGPEMELSRLGFDLPLSADLDRLIWSGPGPDQSWSDCRAGARDGVHAAQKGSSTFSGNKTGVRWAHLLAGDGRSGLSLIATEPLDVDPCALPMETLLFIGRERGCGSAGAPPAPVHRVHVEPGQELSQSVLIEGL